MDDKWEANSTCPVSKITCKELRMLEQAEYPSSDNNLLKNMFDRIACNRGILKCFNLIE